MYRTCYSAMRRRRGHPGRLRHRGRDSLFALMAFLIVGAIDACIALALVVYAVGQMTFV